MTHTLPEIYKMIFGVEFQKQMAKFIDVDTANRRANIHAVKHTTEAWKRMHRGEYKSLFNPEKW